MAALIAALLLLALIAGAKRYNHHAAAKKYFFYIYDSPAWHNISTASFSKRDGQEIMDTSLNHGAGPLVNISAGQFHTDQYQLFALVYHRALRDERRTLNPDKATTFFVPYDFASDSAYYKYCAKSVGRCYDFRCTRRHEYSLTHSLTHSLNPSSVQEVPPRPCRRRSAQRERVLPAQQG